MNFKKCWHPNHILTAFSMNVLKCPHVLQSSMLERCAGCMAHACSILIDYCPWLYMQLHRGQPTNAPIDPYHTSMHYSSERAYFEQAKPQMSLHGDASMPTGPLNSQGERGQRIALLRLLEKQKVGISIRVRRLSHAEERKNETERKTFSTCLCIPQKPQTAKFGPG